MDRHKDGLAELSCTLVVSNLANLSRYPGVVSKKIHLNKQRDWLAWMKLPSRRKSVLRASLAVGLRIG